jgi:hypothetical protein
MSHHLNLFAPYHQGDKTDPIENNLTRGLAISLQNNALLFYKFVELIIDKIPDSVPGLTKDIFAEFRDPRELSISIQVNMQDFEEVVYEKGVIAVCLTTQAHDMELFNTLLFASPEGSRHMADLVIQLNSILLVIEVKISGNDCRQQLNDQIHLLRAADNIIRGSSITWTEILQILYTLSSIQKVAYEKNVFVEDFKDLLEIHFPSIIPAFPFNSFPYNVDRNSVERVKMYRRLHKCVVQLRELSNYPLEDYYDRIPVLVNWGWAREVSFWFAEEKNEGEFLYGYIWPANTKGQGHQVYNRSMDWLKKKSIQTGDHTLDLEITYEIKLCHFNRYVSSIKFTETQLKPGMLLHTQANFYETGMYYKNNDKGLSWDDLVDWFDEHFIDTFNWRKQCGWTDNFLDSNRIYLTVSFGFQVRCLIPYQTLQMLDKKDEDFRKVSLLMADVVTAYEHLLD